MNELSFLGPLRKGLSDDSVTITRVEAGCKVGENFVADLQRIWYTQDTETIQGIGRSLIFKRPPSSKAPQSFIMDCSSLFENEVTAYRCVIPQLQQVVRSLPLPKCYYVEKDYIILEDLQPLGYKSVDKQYGLSLKELQSVLKALAEFHAASFILKAESKENFEAIASQLREAVFSEKNSKECVNVFWEFSLWTGVKSLLTSNETKIRKAAELFGKYEGHVINTMRHWTSCSNQYRVICHGDLWSSNVLIRYNQQGDAEETCLIDLQAMRTGSCVLDLLHIICSSSQQKLLGSHFLSLIKTYYDVLRKTMLGEGYQVPFSIEDLVEEVKNRSSYGLLIAFMMIQSSTNAHATSAEELQQAAIALNTTQGRLNSYPYMSELYHSRIRQMVKDCINSGIIDV